MININIEDSINENDPNDLKFKVKVNYNFIQTISMLEYANTVIYSKDIKINGGILEEKIDNTGYVRVSNEKRPHKVTQKEIVINEKKLEKDVDYTVTYANNKALGTATITITGIGKYQSG